eukprot:TRINITY_DN3103_c0_g1_i1.p2 TRINITY_DN3103_c0_g1~~TRINITY_DN3103_c0_g1_i1.p2  ORF type:complete len:161 (+),score=16.61 TRINITY_DN3103_c0_g1_i1:472-954(+)
MVSNAGRLDLHKLLLILNSLSNPSSSISSKSNFTSSPMPLCAAISHSGEILAVTPEARRAAELAVIKSLPMSAGAMAELTLLIGNMTYTLPISKSSSAERGENRRPIWSERELTRKWLGVSSMSSAALMSWSNWRISPSGKMTLAPLECLPVWVERVQEM